MPQETQAAVDWALSQSYEDGVGDTQQIAKDTPHALVDKVCEYFNAHGVTYSTYSYDDLLPFLS